MNAPHAHVIAAAIRTMEDAIEADTEYWETLAQSTEEAEASGYLEGFRDALSAVHTLIGYGDASTLEGYLEATVDLAKEKREEVAAQ